MGNGIGEENNYTTLQLRSLVALRMLIGWHLLYEGIAKFLNRRVIRTSYAKSVIYFLIAVALLVFFYLLVVNLPSTLP